jgi:hypothetical protein
MRATFAALLLGSAVLGATVYLIEGAAAHLDRATARQCATRDWPVRQDQAHEAFCLREGYALGTRKATGLYTAY